MSPVFAPPVLFTAATPATAVVRSAPSARYGWTGYTVRAGDTLAGIGARTGTTSGALAARNHLVHGGDQLTVGQRLWVPRSAGQARADAASARAARQARAARHARQAAAIRRMTYVVRSGDTLGGIANRTGVSLAALLKANRLSVRSVLQVGERIRIPGRAVRAARAIRVRGTHRAAAPRATVTTYRVRSGDTLGAIASRTATPLGTLYALNRLNARSVIRPGQVIKVHGTPRSSGRSRAAAAPARQRQTYVVRSGDTLSDIAARFHTTLATVLKINHLANANQIQVGEALQLPRPRTRSRSASRAATSANSFAGRTYPVATLNAANRHRAAIARSSVPTRSQTRRLIIAIARRQGVDPKLALAVAWQESGWNQREVSVADAIGVMQVIPSSGVWASQMAGRPLNLLNASDNVTAGVVILRALTRSAGTLDQAIAGYYQGLGSVQSNGMYADTKQYVAAVRSHFGRM